MKQQQQHFAARMRADFSVRLTDVAATDHFAEAAGEAKAAVVAITGLVLATIDEMKRGSTGSSDGGGMSPSATIQ